MEKQTHTPGPWRARENKGLWWNVEVELPCINGLSAWFTVARCDYDLAADGYSNGALHPEADARLIAAAPELLAALKDAERAIIDGIEAQTGREYRERDAIPALHKVRTAIARAEGR